MTISLNDLICPLLGSKYANTRFSFLIISTSKQLIPVYPQPEPCHLVFCTQAPLILLSANICISSYALRNSESTLQVPRTVPSYQVVLQSAPGFLPPFSRRHVGRPRNRSSRARRSIHGNWRSTRSIDSTFDPSVDSARLSSTAIDSIDGLYRLYS